MTTVQKILAKWMDRNQLSYRDYKRSQLNYQALARDACSEFGVPTEQQTWVFDYAMALGQAQQSEPIELTPDGN